MVNLVKKKGSYKIGENIYSLFWYGIKVYYTQRINRIKQEIKQPNQYIKELNSQFFPKKRKEKNAQYTYEKIFTRHQKCVSQNYIVESERCLSGWQHWVF